MPRGFVNDSAQPPERLRVERSRNSATDHFEWVDNGTRILGLSPEGRATVVALKLNNSLAIRVRSNWVQAGWHPPE
jgi:hypothetical protein